MAAQKLESLTQDVTEQQREYEAKRELEKKEHEEKKKKKCEERKPGFDKRWYTDPNAHLSKDDRENNKETPTESEEKDDDEDWDEPTAYTPESRIEMHKYIDKKRKEKGKEPR